MATKKKSVTKSHKSAIDSAPAVKPCNCIDEVNKALKPFNGVLVGGMQLIPAPRRVWIAVEKLDSNVRQKPPARIVAKYCPFCGTAMP